MLHRTRKKIKVIQTEDPNEFQNLYDRIMDELSESEPEDDVQRYNGLHVAYIRYWEHVEEFDCIADEFHAEGIHYLCNQCPYHDPVEDGRKKQVWCKYADYGFTDLRHEACEMFYRKVKQGEIKPVY